MKGAVAAVSKGTAALFLRHGVWGASSGIASCSTRSMSERTTRVPAASMVAATARRGQLDSA
jgi:hypothetical protein